MTYNVSFIFTFCLSLMFLSFLAVHHAHMKSPSQNRVVASLGNYAKPIYDASYKL